MRVIISLQGEYSAIVIPKDAVAVFNRNIGLDAGITLDEYLKKLDQEGEFLFENEQTKRQVKIKRID